MANGYNHQNTGKFGETTKNILCDSCNNDLVNLCGICYYMYNKNGNAKNVQDSIKPSSELQKSAGGNDLIEDSVGQVCIGASHHKMRAVAQFVK